MIDASAETRMHDLAQALTDLSLPLVRLFEYADNLEKLVQAQERLQASCVAAAIRAEARRAQSEIAAALAAVQEAAAHVIAE
jgi:uncharacterized protein YhaN